MSNDKGMGRRQFFSRFLPALTDTIIEKTKVDPQLSTVSTKPEIITNSSVVRQSVPVDQTEVAKGAEEGSGIKFPWVGM